MPDSAPLSEKGSGCTEGSERAAGLTTLADASSSCKSVSMPLLLVCFDGYVLDISTFSLQHPGGAKVLQRRSRQDITIEFRNIGHSQKAAGLMESLRVCSVEDWERKHSQVFIVDNIELSKAMPLDSSRQSPSLLKDFSAEFSYHQRRRTAILAAHPEVEQLYGKSWVPLLYMPICFTLFIYIGIIAGGHSVWPGCHLLQSPLASVIVAWIVLPFLGFGLNNANHEICHGNTPLPATVFENMNTRCFCEWRGAIKYCQAKLTKLVLLANGILTLNHFLFYYYWSSHLSHHRTVGNEADRGHAFRSLYATTYSSREAAVQEEREWMVDGDLFGLYPEFLVNDTADTISSLFILVDGVILSPRLFICYPFLENVYAPVRAVLRFIILSVVFIILRALGDVWMAVNTVLINTLCIPLSLRRPFDIDMFMSGLCLLFAHFLWVYLAGWRSWGIVYASSFSQPTHCPASIYFGYFAGIHGGASSELLNNSGSERERAASRDNGDSALSTPMDAAEAGSSHVSKTCQITVSNYSFLMRFLTFDQSLHLEHHDFPNIPCHLLGKLRHIAPEWYSTENEIQSYANAPIVNKKYVWFYQPWWDVLHASRPDSYASCN